MTRGKRASFVLTVAAAVALAACGGGGDDGGSAATTASSGAPATTAAAGGGGSGASGTSAPDTAASGGSSDVPDLDPCALLTDGDVNAAFALSDLRSPITKVERSRTDAIGSAACTYTWTAENDSNSNFAVFVYGPDVYQSLQSSGTAETVPELPGAYQTFDGLFLGTPTATVSITGVASDAAAASLLAAAVEKAG